MFEKRRCNPQSVNDLGIAGFQNYSLKKLIQLFCIIWGASGINFIDLNMEKSIQGSVSLTVLSQKNIFWGGKIGLFFKNNGIFEKWQVFFFNNNVFLKKKMVKL